MSGLLISSFSRSAFGPSPELLTPSQYAMCAANSPMLNNRGCGRTQRSLSSKPSNAIANSRCASSHASMRVSISAMHQYGLGLLQNRLQGSPMKIFFGAILLSIALGIAVDLVTANVAVDYFAVYHPHVVSSTSPWVLALVWGVGASWWAGAIGGAILAFYNWRLRPRVPSNIVLRWVRNACAVIWSTMIGIVGIVYVYGGL